MEGTEQIADALRRGKRLLLAAVVVGVAVSVLLAQSRGERYEAGAQVLQSDANVTSVFGAGAPADPQRESATGVLLSQSAEFYRRVADQLPAEARDGVGDIAGEFRVDPSPGTDILDVVGISDDPARAVTIANVAAEEYVKFRADALAEPLREAADGVRSQLEDDPESADLRQSLSRLRVLETLSQGEATVTDTASRARRTRPEPVRDALLGLAAGLIAALLGIALYEALSSRRRGLEALRRRSGATAAVVLSARGALRKDAADRLIGALEPARRSDGASVVVVEALDDPQAVERVIELVADALSERGDSVAAPAVRWEDEGPTWSAVRAPRAGGAGAAGPALVTAEPELAGRSYDWILMPGAGTRPGEGDAVVLAVHLEDVRSAAAAGLARRGAEATSGPRVLVALKG